MLIAVHPQIVAACADAALPNKNITAVTKLSGTHHAIFFILQPFK